MVDTQDLQSIKQRFGIIGNSPSLNYALSIAARVAPTNLTVLITGESGVGKEVFSKVIHSLSPRKHNQFIAVNCGAIPEGTIDSELFGHEKGAFTGATESRKGYFEFVNEGTLFLDEIAEMPLGTQARLLRVLESGEYIRVGSSKVQKTDVRVIAASNVALTDRVKEGKFREDLYYRLSTVPIIVPPLRDRQEDIVLLFRKFSTDFAERQRFSPIRLSPEAQDALMDYRWPGNIRQLKNIAEQISVLSKEREVGADELLAYLPHPESSGVPAIRPESFKSSQTSGGSTEHFTDRELLYKVLFELRKDMTEVKQALFEILSGKSGSSVTRRDYTSVTNPPALPQSGTGGDPQPVIIRDTRYDDTEEAEEESLSIAEKEKELIERALAKHKGKRKIAAMDLGISERTLYRKIKEYDIQE